MQEIGLFEAMFSTRALRRLKPDSLPDELITKIVEAGTQAPSGGSEQHWLFVVVKDEAQRRRIAEIYPKALAVMGPAIKKAKIPPHLNQKQRDLIMKGAMYLFQNLADVPVLIFACLRPQEGVDPAILPPEVLAKTGWTERLLGASIYPAVQNMILAFELWGSVQSLPSCTRSRRMKSSRCWVYRLRLVLMRCFRSAIRSASSAR